jgi:hypothetical protein
MTVRQCAKGALAKNLLQALEPTSLTGKTCRKLAWSTPQVNYPSGKNLLG